MPARRREPPSPPLAAIVGATASGKSELAMAIAAQLSVEIVVADSRQVYRGLDIGTAKPSPADRGAVPHHLLDLADPDEAFTLADWLALARASVPAIWARGNLPLLVGGTGLYLTALVDGYQLSPQAPPAELRRELTAEVEQAGLASVAARLTALDPNAAARTDLRNPRRVLRAVERMLLSGASAAKPPSQPWPGNVALLGVERPRSALAARIRMRAEEMFAGGLLEEVERLRAAGYGPELAPMSGHGYREAFRVLDGEWSVDRAVDETARRSRQYAKRQLTWFRRDRRIVWLPVGERPAAALAERAVDVIRRLT
ncbi:MAG TPA: tRNA (adenosine(37)-N6)-dimethylallyltransferase MiaA [Candidatus Limnocylindria bacterium]